jgi:tetratricopeptide (TPR) repeat protein
MVTRRQRPRTAIPSAIDTSRSHAWAPAVVIAVALVVKTILLAQLGGHPLLQPLGELDTAFYVQLARSLATDGLLAGREPFFVAPLYVYFLGAIFALGGTIEIARVVQILLGSVAVGFIFTCARHWFGETTAWVASVLAVLTGLFSFYEILILPAALDPFLVAATLAFVSKIHSGGARSMIAAGIFAGLFALNRPNALVFAAVLAVWPIFWWWRARAQPAHHMPLRRAILLPAALLVVLAANGLRNYAASGEWVLVSSHGGLNFYIGNGPEADGTYARIPGITPSIAGQARDATRVVANAGETDRSAAGVSAFFYRRALTWMAQHPATTVRLWIRKAALLVNHVNVPLNFSYAHYSREEASILRSLIVGPWLLVPLGMAGFLLRPARRSTRVFWVWASFVPIYGLSVMAFFVTSRYRMPLLIPLCCSAAAALTLGYDRIRLRQWKTLAAPAVAVIAFGVLAGWPLGVSEGAELEQGRRVVWLIEQGRVAEARAHAARLEPSHPRPGLLHYRAGRALAGLNRFDDATVHFERSLAFEPDELDTRLELGQALTVVGRSAEAIPLLIAAVEGGHRPEVAAPWLVRALVAAGHRDRALRLIGTWPSTIAAPRAETSLDLGSMALEINGPVEAERWLRVAVTVLPKNAEAHEKLGVSLLLQHRVTDAIASLETARTSAPERATVRLNLAAAYARAGRVDDAKAEAREALRLDPAESQAAALLAALGGAGMNPAPPVPR